MPRFRQLSAVCLTMAVIWLVPAGGIARTPPDSLEECDRQVRDAPTGTADFYCYTLFVRAHGQAEDAVRRLDAILAIHPDLHSARLNLAIIEEMRGSPRTDALYREAVEGLEQDENHRGVVFGSTSLAYRLGKQGLANEAWAELDRSMAAAEQTGDPILRAWVLAAQGLQSLNDSDYGKALWLYRKAETLAFPDGRLDLQCRILSGLGSVMWYFRDVEGAMEVYRRESELWRRLGDRYGEASPRYNLALLATDFSLELGLEEEEIRAIELDALDAAVKAGDHGVEARVRMLLGQFETGAAAVAEYERALALARREGDRGIQLMAKRLIAHAVATIGPDRVDEGFRLMRDAIEEARAMAGRFDEARGRIGLAHMVAVHRSSEEAVPLYLEALDAVEKIRELQPEETVRAQVFSHWDYPYYRTSGLLLQGLDRSSDPDSDIDLAFRTIERHRARSLLDAFDAAGAVVRPEDDALGSERATILEKISETQKQLMRSDLPGTARAELLAELESLEVEEADVRDRIARSDPAFAGLHIPEIPSLKNVQTALGTDQALFSFQLWGSNDRQAYDIDIGVSWLIVVTQEEVEPYALPDRLLIRDQIEIYEGLLANRDGSEAIAAARLYEELVEEAIDDLPETIRRLVIVPDGALHRLPFDTLRTDPEEPPLASRFDISVVPSATVWTGLRKDGEAVERNSRALALADPDFAESSEIDRLRAADPWIEGLRLGRLPHAVDEARALVRTVGGGSRLLTSAEASEHDLKRLDLHRYGILHFAVHAVVDDEKPERSAILLAAGGEHEDGLLQVREIVELDLSGQIVILTGCRSASGTLVEGEGVMGLARAFFQAGASAVIGGLWPLRDDETALLMEQFCKKLGKGESVGAALASARRSRIRAGAPSAAWAGLVVLGNADVVPVSGGRSGWTMRVGLLCALVLVLLIAWSTRRVRRE